MSQVEERSPVQLDVDPLERLRLKPRPRSRALDRLAPWPFWAFATMVLIGCVIFHSRTDPGIRYSIKQLDAANFGPDWFLAQKFGKLTPCDVLIGMFTYLSLCYRLGTQRPVRFSRRAFRWAVVIAIPLVIGFAVGWYHGTTNLGDSRYFIMGSIFALGLWSSILSSEEGAFRWAQIFSGVTGVYGFVQLLEYSRGGGEIAFYGRTPLADHATLEYMVAGVAVSLAMSRTGRTSWLWWFTVASGSMVVVLGFRRYAWVELAAVFGVYLVLSGRKYLKGSMVMLAAAAVGVVVLGSSLNFGGRILSLDPFASKSSNVYATTNQGHINAVLDGLNEVLQHPITGLGTGVSFVGSVTGNQIGQTQNGPVETWVRYSIVGLFVFFLAYYCLFRDLWKRRRGTRYSDQLGWGIGAFLAGQFVIVCTFYPWPFDTPEKAVLTFSVLCMAYPRRDPETGRRRIALPLRKAPPVGARA